MHRSALPFLLCLPLLLVGCDMLGVESASVIQARKEAEGKAVGGACRQAGRAIEDCYAMNRKSDRAGVFAGWREMNDYMRENKMEAATPQAAGVQSADNADAGDAGHDKATDKPDHAAHGAKKET